MPKRCVLASGMAGFVSVVFLSAIAARETPKPAAPGKLLVSDVQEDGPGRVKVLLSTREVPNAVQKVTFQGAKHIKPDELQKITGVSPGMPLNPDLNLGGCHKILAKYEEMGRPFSHCTLVKGGSLDDTEVIYAITEGSKVKVRDIQFAGNTFISGERLAKRVHSSSQWFHRIGGTYNRPMAEADANELLKFFRSSGYAEVSVSLETQRGANGQEVTLIFHIHEGPRSRVPNANPVIGARSIPHEQLSVMSPIKVGEYLSEDKIKTDVDRIKTYFGYDGRDVPVIDDKPH